VSVEHEHLGECLACGYDTAGRSVGDSCPECGAVVVANPFRGGWRSAKVRRRFLRGSRCMVVATALIGASIAGVLLIMLTPLDQYPVTMTISTAMAFSGIAVLAASAVLLAFVWRAIVAGRVLVITIALLLASFVGSSIAPLLGIAPTMEFAGAIWSLLGAAIAAAPIYLARSSGRPMRFRWLPFASSGALIAVAIMALTFSSWGRPYEEFATALVLASQFGTAASFSSLQRSIAVGFRQPKDAVHA
jgi:predicted RNA-binding Zn-ribbon protein involved in translation (DUF1610 family)